jgi:hypothetical protein
LKSWVQTAVGKIDCSAAPRAQALGQLCAVPFSLGEGTENRGERCEG